MDKQMASFRGRMLLRRSGRKKGAMAYSKEDRREALGYAAELRERGQSWAEVGRRLGITAMTVEGWSRRAPGGKLRPVSVAAEVKPLGGDLVLVSPSGYRVQAADVEQMAALIRALQ